MSSAFDLKFLGIPCNTALTQKTLASSQFEVDYVSSTSTTKQEIGDWTTFFTNSDETNCPISSCILVNLVKPANHVSIGTASPWKVEASSAIFKSTTINAEMVQCIIIKNGATYQFQSQVFSLKYKGVDCTQKFKPQVLSAFPKVKYVTESTSRTLIGGWDSFFTNSDDVACSIISFVLEQETTREEITFLGAITASEDVKIPITSSNL